MVAPDGAGDALAGTLERTVAAHVDKVREPVVPINAISSCWRYFRGMVSSARNCEGETWAEALSGEFTHAPKS